MYSFLDFFAVPDWFGRPEPYGYNLERIIFILICILLCIFIPKKLKKDISKLKVEKDRIAQENAVLKSRLIKTQSDKENLKTGLRDIVNVAMDNIKSDDAKRNIKDKRDDLMKKYK
jgi:hypothetical protein